MSVQRLRSGRARFVFEPTVPKNDSDFERELRSQLQQGIDHPMLVTEADRPQEDQLRRILHCNAAFEKLFGYDCAEVEGRSASILAHPDSPPEPMAILREAGRLFRPAEVEFEALSKQGEHLTLEIRAIPVFDDSGWCCHWINLIKDITEQKTAVQKSAGDGVGLTAQEIGIWSINFATGQVEWDETMYRIHQLEPGSQAFTLDDWVALLPPADQRMSSAIVGEALQRIDSGQKYTFVTIVTPRGFNKLIGLHGRRADDDPNAVYGIAWDRSRELASIRELDEHRNALTRRNRFAAMGELAIGIGHEIRNPLQIAQGHLDLARNDPRSNLEHLDKAMAALEQIGVISDGLRNFGRSSAEPESRESLHLGELLHEALRLAAPILARNGIRFECGCEEQPGLWVRASRNRIQQVFLNLFANARDAMQDAEEKLITIKAWKTDGTVIVEIGDTGPGIDPMIRDSLFREAVTTKRYGEGTGIGLTMCKAILEDFDGGISALPGRPGEGATFQIRLPAETSLSTNESHDTAEAPREQGERLPETVMLVDDEEGIRQLLRTQLGGLGVNVLDFEAVAPALEWLLRREKTIDVLVCDLNLPGSPGTELARAVRDQGLDVRRFIFLTGSSSGEVSEMLGDEELGIHTVLTKPFRFRELLPHLKL